MGVAGEETNMADVKSDVRSLRDKMDVMNSKVSERTDNFGAQLTSRIDAMSAQLNDKIDRLNTSLTAELNTKIDSVKDSIAAAKIWALILYMALAGGMFGTMARGFGWI